MSFKEQSFIIPAKALERLLVGGLDELSDALMHDSCRQHLQLVKLADEPDVAQRPAPSAHFLLFPVGLESFETEIKPKVKTSLHFFRFNELKANILESDFAFQYLNGFLLGLVVSSLKQVSLKLGFVEAVKVISLKLLLASRDQQLSEVNELCCTAHVCRNLEMEKQTYSFSFWKKVLSLQKDVFKL